MQTPGPQSVTFTFGPGTAQVTIAEGEMIGGVLSLEVAGEKIELVLPEVALYDPADGPPFRRHPDRATETANHLIHQFAVEVVGCPLDEAEAGITLLERDPESMKAIIHPQLTIMGSWVTSTWRASAK